MDNLHRNNQKVKHQSVGINISIGFLQQSNNSASKAIGHKNIPTYSPQPQSTSKVVGNSGGHQVL